jgi:hypothetical protein
MKNYYEIKEEELEVTEDYSDKKMYRYIWLCKILRKMYSEAFFWIISSLPFFAIPGIFIYLGFFGLDIMTVSLFVLTHFIYWHLSGRKEVIRIIDETVPELDLTIEVLEDIRKERNG